MNNKCEGLIGKWFGHNYKQYCVESKLPRNANFEFDYAADVTYYKDRTYIVRCKRCGHKIK